VTSLFHGGKFFHLTERSLLRANVLSIAGLALGFLLSHFPDTRANPLLALALLIVLCGVVDAIRCMQSRWNFYQGAVVMSLYMDILILTLVMFFLLWPYFHWLL
jgi:hypothetical protein